MCVRCDWCDVVVFSTEAKGRTETCELLIISKYAAVFGGDLSDCFFGHLHSDVTKNSVQCTIVCKQQNSPQRFQNTIRSRRNHKNDK